MRRLPASRLLAVVAAVAVAVFVALTIVVTTSAPLGVDEHAFRIAHDVRAPWLDHVARAVTTLGLIVVVAPVLLACAALLIGRGERVRAAALIAGVAVTWISVWIVKAAVDRPRPPAPLVHTTGQSYPSGHAANSVGWLALAIGIAVLIPTRGGRITALIAGFVLAALIGLTRVYLRAHYASDVVAGEALAAAIYALAAISSVAWARRKQPPIGRRQSG